jgi:transposase
MAALKVITLSDDDREYLQSLVRRRTIQAQMVDRAKILLYKEQGDSYQVIADRIDVNIKSVKLCIDKYLDGGIERALFDDDRAGRPVEITDDARAWIVSVACQKPCELGYTAELWTLGALHKHIQANAEASGYPRLKTITKPWLQKYLKGMDIKPFKIKYYLERKDPEFERKMHDVLVVYKQVEMQFDKEGDICISS